MRGCGVRGSEDFFITTEKERRVRDGETDFEAEFQPRRGGSHDVLPRGRAEVVGGLSDDEEFFGAPSRSGGSAHGF